MTLHSNSGVRLSTLAAMLLALFAVDNLLLLAFLGLPPLLTLLAIILTCPLVAIMTAKAVKTEIIVPWKAIAICGFVAGAIYALGGEGRFFYANADWQVRDAILADMARLPWPFAYQLEGQPVLLRAPIGLFLLPSLAGGGWHEIAMLASNSVRLTLLFALCWPLFNSNRARWIGLTGFVLFSGIDIVGTAIFDALGARPSWDHIERWNFNNQYSAHLTQAFWVPQHALAGWVCAACFMLWHKGIFRIGLFAAAIPLVAIWSPLSIMGAVPFVLWAGFSVLKSRDWNLRDVAMAAVALAVALPALAYLQVDAAKLGSGPRDISLLSYVLLVLLEVFPFVLPPLLSRSTATGDRMLLWLILACLLAIPLWQVGISSDFQMRASIMPLALLAVAFALWLSKVADRWPQGKAALAFGAGLLALGAVTPVMEFKRAVSFGPSPEPKCSLLGVWNRQVGLMTAPYSQYLAPRRAFPALLPEPKAIAGLDDPQNCWGRSWKLPA